MHSSDNNTRKFIFSLILGLVILGVLISFGDLDELITTSLSLDAIIIFHIFVVYSISWIIRGFRWKLILSYDQIKISTWESTMFGMIGNFANLILPARAGEVSRILAISKSKSITFVRGTTSVLIDRVFDFMGIILLIWFCLIFLPISELPRGVRLIIQISSSFFIIFLFTSILISGKERLNLNKYSKTLARYINIISQKLSESNNSLPILLSFSLLSSLAWIFEILIASILVFNLGIEISAIVIVLAVSISNISKVFPLTPGGLGVYESVFIGVVLTFSNVDYDVVMSLAIIEHLVKKFYVFLFGSISVGIVGKEVLSISGE